MPPLLEPLLPPFLTQGSAEFNQHCLEAIWVVRQTCGVLESCCIQCWSADIPLPIWMRARYLQEYAEVVILCHRRSPYLHRLGAFSAACWPLILQTACLRKKLSGILGLLLLSPQPLHLQRLAMPQTTVLFPKLGLQRRTTSLLIDLSQELESYWLYCIVGALSACCLAMVPAQLASTAIFYFSDVKTVSHKTFPLLRINSWSELLLWYFVGAFDLFLVTFCVFGIWI